MNIYEVTTEYFDSKTGEADSRTKTKIMAKNSSEAAQIHFNYLSQHHTENFKIVNVTQMWCPRQPWETRNALL